MPPTKQETLTASFIASLSEVEPGQWNAVTGTDYPFTRYEFLRALEESGATNTDSGWQPHHLLIHNAQQELIAVLPLYLKEHSYGEYVFDWSWANAYQQHGLNYYPKLLGAIPFTPATGPRLCVHPAHQDIPLTDFVSQSLRAEAEHLGASSIHVLFPELSLHRELSEAQLEARLGVQYHWFNHGFKDFDAFLETFSSRKRKSLKRERRRVREQGLELRLFSGREISPELWKQFYYFYQLTYAKRSGHGGYLSQAFFEQVAATMPEHLVLVLAYDPQRQSASGDALISTEKPIAGALNFRSQDTLYGRYWGCLAEYDFLHFEACYYQGIEYCIREGLKRFDSGAQGEHKIQRGFEPILTYSNHWIAHADFARAIHHFLEEEAVAIKAHLKAAQQALPFKEGYKPL